MRVSRILLIFLLPLAVACKVLPNGGIASPPSDGGQSVAGNVALDVADSRAPREAMRPKPRPGTDDSGLSSADGDGPNEVGVNPVAAIAPEPPVGKSKEQTICEKRGNTWGTAGKSGGKTCIKRTRDAGKQCTKKSSCDGVCLARSGTCAPVTPLFGCNDILQNDGSRVTLCVD